MNLCLVADEAVKEVVTLAEHDKRFHKHGYREGQKCKYREGMAKGDRYDSAVAAMGMMKDWVPGLSVGYISKERTDKLDFDSAEGIRRFVLDHEQKALDNYVDQFLNQTLPRNAFVRLTTRAYPIINRCAQMWFKGRYKGPAKIKINESCLNRNRHSNTVHLPDEEYKNILKWLDDPLAITPPDDANPDSLICYVKVGGLKERVPGVETDIVTIPLMYNDKHPETDIFFEPMTAFPAFRSRLHGKHHCLYINEQEVTRLCLEGCFTRKSGVPTVTYSSKLPATMRRENFSTHLPSSISKIDFGVKAAMSEKDLCEKYLKSLNGADFQSAFEYMEEYARRKGYVWHSVPFADEVEEPEEGKGKGEGKSEEKEKEDKKGECGGVKSENAKQREDFPFSCFISLNNGMIKSDDFELDDNRKYVSLETRFSETSFDEAMKKAMNDFISGKKTDGAIAYENYFRRFKDGEGKTAGFYDLSTNSVCLVKGRADAKTVAHEIGWHATYEWARKNHPELYKTLRKYAEDTTEGVKKAVVAKYGAELGADALLDEIGAERFTRENMERIDRASKEWWDKVENGQNELRGKYVKANMPKALSKEELDVIAKLPPKKAVETLVEAMISGRSLGKPRKNDSKAKRYLRMVKDE